MSLPLTITPEMKDEVLRRVKSGQKKTQIAKDLNLSKAVVYKFSPKTVLTADEIEQIVQLVDAGKSIDEVARQFHRSPNYLSKYVRHISKKAKRAAAFPEVRRRILAGENMSSVAHYFGYSDTSMSKIVSRVLRDFELNEEQINAIFQARRDGKKIVEIASKLSLPLRCVRDSLGVNNEPHKLTKNDRNAAVNAVAAGRSRAEVANELGVSRPLVCIWFREAVERGDVKKPSKMAKTDDFDFLWISRKDPELEDWRKLIIGWYEENKPNFSTALAAITLFIDKYLIALRLPKKPADLLRRGQLWPDFFDAVCPKKSNRGHELNRIFYQFIEWVLDSEHFADVSDYGVIRLSNIYTNPFKPDSGNESGIRRSESSKVVMAYYLISDLRKQIVQGIHFKDWIWVQGLGGTETINGQQYAADWFPVAEDRIDQNDPDCVSRWRHRENDPPILEMWSPVRWVLQLLHLQTTTRVGQARMLDSGEADTFIYSNGEFVLNSGPLKLGTIRKPRQQGVFRRPSERDQMDGAKVYLFFNTNKTADIGKNGDNKGFLCPWPQLENLDEDPYYWLEKLRDWQMKYNPINRLTSWTELTGGRKLSAVSKEKLAEYSDTAFLFRAPEYPEFTGPIGAAQSNHSWKKLMAAYECILLKKEIRHPSGKPIQLINPENGFPWSSPHATRVSLITHMILDGNVPIELMMKVVGHARFIMTVYYTKLSLGSMQDAIKDAVGKLDAIKYESFERDLLSIEEEKIRNKVVFNAEDWTTVLPSNPAARTPLGWLHMHDGICLAGGNSELEHLPGCHNGGAKITNAIDNKKSRHGPVPGGVRNCCRCRWKCAGKVHVPAMAASLNNRSYHLHRASTRAISAERERNLILQEKAEVESSGQLYRRTTELIDAERRYEASMQMMQQLALDIVEIHTQIERALSLPDNVDGSLTLAAQGDVIALNAVLVDVDSELMVLAGICADVEFYPDLDPGTAVFEFAQLLDQAFERDGYPMILARLSEQEKLTCANAIMRELERQADPDNCILGRRKVVEIMDRGESLENILGIKLKDIRKLAVPNERKIASIRLVGRQKENDRDDD